MLIVGNTHDPATNYSGALETRKLMPNSYLVSSDSWGHTAYGTSDCVTDRVDAYLTGLVKPAGTPECIGNVKPFSSALTKMSVSRAGGLARILPTRAGLPPVAVPGETDAP